MKTSRRLHTMNSSRDEVFTWYSPQRVFCLSFCNQLSLNVWKLFLTEWIHSISLIFGWCESKRSAVPAWEKACSGCKTCTNLNSPACIVSLNYKPLPAIITNMSNTKSTGIKEMKIKIKRKKICRGSVFWFKWWWQIEGL